MSIYMRTLRTIYYSRYSKKNLKALPLRTLERYALLLEQSSVLTYSKEEYMSPHTATDTHFIRFYIMSLQKRNLINEQIRKSQELLRKSAL